MELKEFNNLIVHTPNEAKNFMSFLLGYNFSDNKKSELAVLRFFDNLPEQFKVEKKLFEPMFIKFFTKYSVNENNIHYYNDYIKNNSERAKIVEKNPNWIWQEEVKFNSLSEFLKAFNKMKTHERENILEKNKNLLNTFFKEKPKKSVDSAIKAKFFENLIHLGYDVFKNICKNNNLSELYILQKISVDSYYGFSGLIRYGGLRKKEHFDLLLDTILNETTKDDFFKEDPFNKLAKNKFSSPYNSNKYGAASTMMLCIAQNNMGLAVSIAKYFPDEVLDQLQSIADKSVVRQIHYHEINLDLLKNVSEALKGVYSSGSLEYAPLQKNSDLVECFINHYNIIQNKERLDSILPDNKSERKKTKL